MLLTNACCKLSGLQNLKIIRKPGVPGYKILRIQVPAIGRRQSQFKVGGVHPHRFI
jgi:hypothetical protein